MAPAVIGLFKLAVVQTEIRKAGAALLSSCRQIDGRGRGRCKSRTPPPLQATDRLIARLSAR